MMKNNNKPENGQALIEFALSLSVIIFIIVGVFDLGRAFHAAIVIENASREGARFGTRNPDDNSGMQTAIIQEAQNSGIALTSSNISIACYDPGSDGCDTGWPVTVTITYDFNPVLKLFLPNNLQLVRATKMMVP